MGVILQTNAQYNLLLGITLLVTAVTSVTATFVIGIEIYTSTILNRRARKRYTHIIEIVAQSSALYSLAILFQAIESLSLYGYRDRNSPGIPVLVNLEYYTAGIMTFTTV